MNDNEYLVGNPMKQIGAKDDKYIYCASDKELLDIIKGKIAESDKGIAYLSVEML
jgi:hypothetical protein